MKKALKHRGLPGMWPEERQCGTMESTTDFDHGANLCPDP